jgi:hypothetical protein
MGAVNSYLSIERYCDNRFLTGGFPMLPPSLNPDRRVGLGIRFDKPSFLHKAAFGAKSRSL